jgi:hypothetical protein
MIIMNLRKSNEAGEKYLVESSIKGKYWKVDLAKKTCNCPNFLFRKRASGEVCKHIIAVQQMLSNDSKDDFEKAVDYVKEKGEVDSVELIERFSEGLVNELIERGQLAEYKGRIKVVD